MLVTLTRRPDGSTLATIRRGDGVVVGLPGHDRRHRIPHDLAHLVAERELGIRDGVFGSIASGGMFDNMHVVAGRPRHDAAERSKRLLDSNKRWLGIAELMADAVQHAAESGIPADAAFAARRFWTAFNTEPFPWADADLAGAVTVLIGLAETFGDTGKLEMPWPARLTKPVPPPSTGVHRNRRGRTTTRARS
ncbi:hypothetical protein [Actinoplanes sp. NPDC049265]|uniref:hypothetical protein n=1 Tax=Actinoplanes sp. NPDC049265 TaxID=3363902 RepID=UPI00371B9D4E